MYPYTLHVSLQRLNCKIIFHLHDLNPPLYTVNVHETEKRNIKWVSCLLTSFISALEHWPLSIWRRGRSPVWNWLTGGGPWGSSVVYRVRRTSVSHRYAAPPLSHTHHLSRYLQDIVTKDPTDQQNISLTLSWFQHACKKEILGFRSSCKMVPNIHVFDNILTNSTGCITYWQETYLSRTCCTTRQHTIRFSDNRDFLVHGTASHTLPSLNRRSSDRSPQKSRNSLAYMFMYVKCYMYVINQ